MNSDTSAEQVVAPCLANGERLLWAGRPKQGLLLRPSDLFWIPFSLLWAGFAVYWEYLAVKSGQPMLWRFWGVPFILAGLYLVFGRFLVDSATRSSTYYGVSDGHGIIVTVRRKPRLTRLSVRDFQVTLRGESKWNWVDLVQCRPCATGCLGYCLAGTSEHWRLQVRRHHTRTRDL